MISDGFDAAQFQAGFVAEAEEHLRFATRTLLDLDAVSKRGEASPKAARDLFRSLHTLKGLAGMIGVDPIVEISHVMETVLRAADKGGGRISLKAVDLLLEGVRAIEERVSALGLRKPVPNAPAALLHALGALEALPVVVRADVRVTLPPEMLSKLAAGEIEQLSQAVRTGKRALRIDFLPTAARAAAGVSISTVRETLATLGDIVRVLPVALPASETAPGGLSFVLVFVTSEPDESFEALSGVTVVGTAAVQLDVESSPATQASDDFPATSATHDFVRVDVGKLDDAIERLGSLVVNRHRLRRAADRLSGAGADARELKSLLVEQGTALRDLRTAILRARMVPVSELLERVPLMVRTLTRATGKDILLEIDAGDAELDKSVADRIFPAIVHLVRNAVDHGIESPEVRRAAGKPPAGNLQLSVHSRGDHHLSLSIRDDGAGIDRVKVAHRAGRDIPPTESGLLDLLCIAGLSTTELVTETSGRGVGMEIVRRVVENELGGELRLTTAAGRGTAFTMTVPLTLSIVDSFTFSLAGQVFAVPVAGVEEILALEDFTQQDGPGRAGSGRTRLLQRRGEILPLVDLATCLRLPVTEPPRKGLVVRREGIPFAFGVERMLGQQELVVRPLEDPLVRVVGVSGAADLGDGRPTLMLDLAAFAAAVSREAA